MCLRTPVCSILKFRESRRAAKTTVAQKSAAQAMLWAAVTMTMQQSDDAVTPTKKTARHVVAVITRQMWTGAATKWGAVAH